MTDHEHYYLHELKNFGNIFPGKGMVRELSQFSQDRKIKERIISLRVIGVDIANHQVIFGLYCVLAIVLLVLGKQ